MLLAGPAVEAGLAVEAAGLAVEATGLAAGFAVEEEHHPKSHFKVFASTRSFPC